jgi:hypothetical protein
MSSSAPCRRGERYGRNQNSRSKEHNKKEKNLDVITCFSSACACPTREGMGIIMRNHIRVIWACVKASADNASFACRKSDFPSPSILPPDCLPSYAPSRGPAASPARVRRHVRYSARNQVAEISAVITFAGRLLLAHAKAWARKFLPFWLCGKAHESRVCGSSLLCTGYL